MKSLLVFIRIIIVGLLWGIVFTEGIRVIMLCNWHFDIFWPDHWRQLKELWQAGWTVRAPKEWAFVILLFTFIPMLITGWWTISLVAWEELIYKLFTSPVSLYKKFFKSPVSVINTTNKYGVVKRKSYKQIRPAGINNIHSPISDYGDTRAAISQAAMAGTQAASSPYAQAYNNSSLSAAATRVATKIKKPDVAATIDHALFKFDDDDDDFDLDIDSFEKADIKKPAAGEKVKAKRFNFDDDDDDDNVNKEVDEDDNLPEAAPAPKRRSKTRDNNKENESGSRKKDREVKNQEKSKTNNKSTSAKKEQESASKPHSPVYDTLLQRNYDVISDVKVKDVTIDYIGVTEGCLCLCLVDKESGDWLADEEMFNGEEPLWFSENSHRISPVCLLNKARKNIKELLDEEDFDYDVKSFVIIQMANIINADDMFDIWGDMGIYVTRINRGAPKDIHLFSKTISEANDNISKKELDRLTNLLKKLS